MSTEEWMLVAVVIGAPLGWALGTILPIVFEGPFNRLFDRMDATVDALPWNKGEVE